MWERGDVLTNLVIGEETWGCNQRGHCDGLNIVFRGSYTDLIPIYH